MDFLPIIIFGPAVEIVLLIVALNIVAYGIYAWLYQKDFQKIAMIDLRFSVIEVLLLIANYAGSGATVLTLGSELAWYWYYIIVSIPLEIAFFIAYKKCIGARWAEVFEAEHKVGK